MNFGYSSGASTANAYQLVKDKNKYKNALKEIKEEANKIKNWIDEEAVVKGADKILEIIERVE